MLEPFRIERFCSLEDPPQIERFVWSGACLDRTFGPYRGPKFLGIYGIGQTLPDSWHRPSSIVPEGGKEFILQIFRDTFTDDDS